jgi:hypothetical protein
MLKLYHAFIGMQKKILSQPVEDTWEKTVEFLE